MNVFIFGITGKMGCSLISCAAEQEDVVIVQTVDVCDVVLDFSVSQAAVAHIQTAQRAYKPFVLGTTGLPSAAFDALQIASQDIPVIQSANFSIGMALCLDSARRLGNILYERSRIEIFETHHMHKKDRPSGTALALAQAIGSGPVVYDTPPTTSQEIAIHSRRQERHQDQTVGEHHVIVTTAHETLEIKHTAHSRAAFAIGAIQAARWLLSQSPGLYTIQDLFADASCLS